MTAKASDSTLLKSLSDTRKLAQVWSKRLKPGMVLALIGELGAGKTTFVRLMCEELKSSGHVSSPTFTLMHRYLAKWPIYHIDCYRLESPESAIGAGLQEFLPSNDGVTVIEWGNKFMDLLPDQTQFLEFKIVDENSRSVSIWSRS